MKTYTEIITGLYKKADLLSCDKLKYDKSNKDITYEMLGARLNEVVNALDGMIDGDNFYSKDTERAVNIVFDEPLEEAIEELEILNETYKIPLRNEIKFFKEQLKMAVEMPELDEDEETFFKECDEDEEQYKFEMFLNRLERKRKYF